MSKLYDLIRYIEKGTHLHIGVMFLRNYGGEQLQLPYSATIHDAPYCWQMKQRAGGMARCYRCRNAALRKAVHTRQAFYGKCINGLYEYTHPICVGGQAAAIIFIGNILNGEMGTEGEMGEADCRSIAALLEEVILTHISQEKAADVLIRNMCGYIEENLALTPGLAVLADIFHYNEKYLGRRFKEQMGETVSQYRNRRRLEKAARLLVQSDANVRSIAVSLGYDNVGYFNRLFKETYGCAPLEYNKKDRVL